MHSKILLFIVAAHVLMQQIPQSSLKTGKLGNTCTAAYQFAFYDLFLTPNNRFTESLCRRVEFRKNIIAMVGHVFKKFGRNPL